MHEPALFAARDRNGLAPSAPASKLADSLRELVRSGYVVDADAAGEGLLVRHKVGPDLILHEDGTVALAVSSPPAKGGRPARAPRRIYWRRTFLVAFIAIIAWSLSVLLGVALLSG